MIRPITIRFLLAGALLALLPAALDAQSAVRASIPFQFRAGDQMFPAGRYHITIDPAHHQVVLTGGQATGVVNLLQYSLREVHNGNGMLLFHRYGGQYFLRKVHNGVQAQAYDLVRSKAEREMARTSQMNLAQVELEP